MVEAPVCVAVEILVADELEVEVELEPVAVLELVVEVEVEFDDVFTDAFAVVPVVAEVPMALNEDEVATDAASAPCEDETTPAVAVDETGAAAAVESGEANAHCGFATATAKLTENKRAKAMIIRWIEIERSIELDPPKSLKSKQGLV